MEIRSLDKLLYAVRWGRTRRKSAVRYWTAKGPVQFCALAAALIFFGVTIVPEFLNRADIGSHQNATPINPALDGQLAALEAQVKAAPDNVQARLSLAKLLVDANRHDSAVAMIRATTPKVSAPQERIMLARLLMQLRENDQAIEVLEPVSALTHEGASGSAFEAIMLTGEAYLRTRNWPMALASGERIAGTAEGHFLVARALDAIGDGEGARARLDQITPEQAEKRRLTTRLSLYKAERALAQGDGAGALAHGDHAKASGANPFDTQILDIRVAIVDGRIADARAWIDGSKPAARDHPAMTQARAHMAAYLGKWALAGRLLDEVEDWPGGDLRRSLFHARIKSRTGDWRQASKIVQGHLAMAPDDAQARDLEIGVLLDQGHLVEARIKIAELNRLLASSEQAHYRHYQLAMIDGEVDGALNILWQAAASQKGFGHVGFVSHSHEMFERRVAALRLRRANQPQKAMALLVSHAPQTEQESEPNNDERRDRQSPVDSGLVDPLKAISAIDRLLVAGMMIDQFKDEDATSLLRDVPYWLQQSARYGHLAARLAARAPNPEEASGAILTAAGLPVDGGFYGDDQPAFAIMDRLRRNDLASAISLYRRYGASLVDKRIDHAFAVTLLDQGTAIEDGTIVEAIGSRLIRNIDDPYAMLDGAKLYEMAGFEARAGNTLRELVIHHPAHPSGLMALVDFAHRSGTQQQVLAFVNALKANSEASSDYVDGAILALRASGSRALGNALGTAWRRKPTGAYAFLLSDHMRSTNRRSGARDIITSYLSAQKGAVSPDEAYLLGEQLNRLGDRKAASLLLATSLDGVEGLQQDQNPEQFGDETHKIHDLAVYWPLLGATTNTIIEEASGRPTASQAKKLDAVMLARKALMGTERGFETKTMMLRYARALELAGYDGEAGAIRRELAPLEPRSVKAAHDKLSETGTPFGITGFEIEQENTKNGEIEKEIQPKVGG